MKRKFIAIGIISIFILNVIAAVSVVGVKVNTTVDEEKLPDLKIYFNARYSRVLDDFLAEISIINVGEKEIPCGNYITYTIHCSEILTLFASFKLFSDFKPGDSYVMKNVKLRLDYRYGGNEIYVEVDPTDFKKYDDRFNPDPEHGIIRESNEDNVLYLSLPNNVKPCSHNVPFLRIFNKLPIFQGILGKIIAF